MKRKVTDTRLREIVRARITKGDAFRLDHAAYEKRQEQMKAELGTMTRGEIMTKYPWATFDLK